MISETSRRMKRGFSVKRDLSPNQTRFLELMQELDFGRIDGVVVIDGGPALDPPPRIVQEIKFGGENGPRSEVALEDFILKKEVVGLLKELGGLDDGTTVNIDVKHGLPFKMEVERSLKT